MNKNYAIVHETDERMFYLKSMLKGVCFRMPAHVFAPNVLVEARTLSKVEDGAQVFCGRGSDEANALAEAVNEPLNNEYEFVYDRSQRREQRPKKEIGISAVRGGTIVGEHEIIFAGQDEVIELKHTAYSRAIFGKGAVSAALYLAGKEAGMYDMSDVIG